LCISAGVTVIHSLGYLFAAYYIYGMEKFLSIIGEYMEVHSTFSDDISKIPSYIVNHGECIITMCHVCYHLCPPCPLWLLHRSIVTTRSGTVSTTMFYKQSNTFSQLIYFILLVCCSHQSCSSVLAFLLKVHSANMFATKLFWETNKHFIYSYSFSIGLCLYVLNMLAVVPALENIEMEV